MDYIRRANDRGAVDFDWLKSRHSFSFGHYYDPAHMGFSVLRVINDDQVAPGTGFDPHPHRDMEIISYVVSGAIKHEDNMGNTEVLSPGEVQRMTAGTGVMHAEYNPSDSDPLHLLQIWLLPNRKNLTPGYEQKRINQTDTLTPLVTPDRRDGSLLIHQDTSLYRLVLTPEQPFELETGKRYGYLHIVAGDLLIDGKPFAKGDAVGFGTDRNPTLEAGSHGVEALWFDLPPVN